MIWRILILLAAVILVLLILTATGVVNVSAQRPLSPLDIFLRFSVSPASGQLSLMPRNRLTLFANDSQDVAGKPVLRFTKPVSR